MTQISRFYGWILVAIFFVIYCINAVFPYAGGSVINAYMAKDLNMEKSILGLGFSFFTISTGFVAPLVAICINKWGVRFTMFFGSLIVLSASLLMALMVTNGWQYVVVFGIIMGTGTSAGGYITSQAGVTFWFRKRRALALSIVLSSAGIGALIAAPLLNKIIAAANGNWKAGWFFICGMSALAAVLSILFVKNKPSDIGQVPDGITENEENINDTDKTAKGLFRVYRATLDWRLGDAIRTFAFWAIAVGYIAYCVPFFICIAHGVIHLRDLGHSPDTAALSVGLLLLCSTFGRLSSGFFGDRIEPRYIWSLGLLFLVAGTLVFINATSMLSVYFYAVLVGIGMGVSYVCMGAMIGNYFGAHSFSSIMGAVLPIGTIFASTSPFLAGLMYDHQGNYRMALAAAAIITFISIPFLFFAKPPMPALTTEARLNSEDK